MTTALNDMKNRITAFNGLCDAYLVKPIDRSKLIETLQQLKLVD
jgi:two-component system chemotaxis response regulator CheY